MRRLLLFVTALFLVVTTDSTTAQIEIDPDGNVSIGRPNGPLPERKLVVWADNISGSAPDVYGIWGRAIDASNGARGVLGTGARGYDNYGIQGYASESTNNSFAVFGSTGTGGTRYAGYFTGNVHISGTLTNPSDARFKEQVQSLTAESSVLSRLTQLQPRSFVYTQNPAYQHMDFPEGEHFGLIAQDVERVFPNLVKEDVRPATTDFEEEGYGGPGEEIHFKSVNYMELIPVLVQAIQEQQAVIEEQQRRIEALETER